jgi:hypothetical protein
MHLSGLTVYYTYCIIYKWNNKKTLLDEKRKKTTVTLNCKKENIGKNKQKQQGKKRSEKNKTHVEKKIK